MRQTAGLTPTVLAVHHERADLLLSFMSLWLWLIILFHP